MTLLIKSFLISFGAVAFVLVGVSHFLNTLNIGGYANYAEAYEAFTNADFDKQTILDKETWKESGGQVTSFDSRHIWFSEKDDFKIGKYGYIHNAFYIWFDPLALYWHFQLRRWAHENLTDHQHINDEDF